MGLFNLFKGHAKDKKNDSMPVHNGPTYLEGFASPIQNFKDKTGQWRAKLVSPDGNTQFKIKYYGQRHEKSENLIVGTEIAPPLVLAVHITTEDTILLLTVASMDIMPYSVTPIPQNS